MEEKDTVVYAVVLVDTLKKKLELLNDLKKCCQEQNDLLKQDSVDADAFDQTIEEKDCILKKIHRLDDGFDKVYHRADAELTANKAAYKREIIMMQELIRKIADCSAHIQALEERNKQKFQSYLTIQRNGIKLSTISNQTAGAYYKNMANQHQMGQSYFLDKKK